MNRLLLHYQNKYYKKRIIPESFEEIKEDIADLKKLADHTPEEAEALWWLKVLLCRGEGVYERWKSTQ